MTTTKDKIMSNFYDTTDIPCFGVAGNFSKSDVLDLEEIRSCSGGNREEKLRRKNDG
jgi:hypothetical protein